MNLKKVLKSIIFIIICFIPVNKIKIYLINLIPGYNFNNVKIGYFNIFLVNEANVSNSFIGNLNFFNISKLNMINGARIGSKNIFYSIDFHKSKLQMNKSQISFNNYFEFNNEVVLGEDVVFGGSNSKLIINYNEKTIFKSNIFIGSNCIIMSGVKIAENVTIGAGSIITNSITKAGLYFSKKLTS